VTAAVAFLLFALIGAGVMAVCAALNSQADARLAEWDDAEAAHDDANGAW
jgi:hypothetical protein